MDWEGRLIISATEGKLRSILARWRLDQLITLTEQKQQAARQAVQQELEKELRKTAPEYGAKILSVKLDNLQVENEITRQWIKVWQSRWQRWSIEQLARGEADRIYLYERAKAGAQMGLIVRIARALQELTNQETVTPRVVLMRLFSVLDRADFAASSRIFFPGEALKALDSMRSLLAPGNHVNVYADPIRILTGGDHSAITVWITDQQGKSVPDGTRVSFSTSLGDIVPGTTATINGMATTTLTSGPEAGIATVSAQVNSTIGSVEVTFTP